MIQEGSYRLQSWYILYPLRTKVMRFTCWFTLRTIRAGNSYFSAWLPSSQSNQNHPFLLIVTIKIFTKFTLKQYVGQNLSMQWFQASIAVGPHFSQWLLFSHLNFKVQSLQTQMASVQNYTWKDFSNLKLICFIGESFWPSALTQQTYRTCPKESHVNVSLDLL